MGLVREVRPVLFFAGILCPAIEVFEPCKILLEAGWGPIYLQSDWFEFTHTDYYEKEMGKNLKKSFIVFRDLADPVRLPQVKVAANLVEARFMDQGARSVNIDPGYIDPAKVVLASTKDYYHRLYLSQGIYAEATLRFVKTSYQPFEWTYPDYREEKSIAFFNRARRYLLDQRERRPVTQPVGQCRVD